MSKILYVVNDAWFFVSHRLPLADKVIAEGMSAVLVAQADDTVATVESHGVKFQAWELSPRGKSLFHEFKAFHQLLGIVREEKPDIVHLVTIKPVLYGGLICRILKVPAVVYAISGLGAIFVAKSPTARFVKALITPFYHLAIGHRNSCLVFQNTENRDALLAYLKRPSLDTTVIRGAGVRVEKFTDLKEPADTLTFTLAARLLKDKGIGEFVEAARLLTKRGIQARFVVAGDLAGQGNPASYSSEEIAELANASPVEFIGYTADIPALFANTSVVVLPSYHEGLPKVLVEAGAAAKPVITTNVPGCRDAITPDVTGLLVPVRRADALADAMQTLAQDPARRVSMGLAGRALVEAEMKIEAISEQHMDLYKRLLRQAS